MSNYALRLDGSGALPKKGTVVLDWIPRSKAATIRMTHGSLDGWALASDTRLLLALAGAVYCIDKIDRRAKSDDGWTRDLSLVVPTPAESPLLGKESDVEHLLGFLTGDRWSLRFRTSKAKVATESAAPIDKEAVCLFSGGLDSLCGAIEVLEQGGSICLLSHHEGGIVSRRQTELATALGGHYGRERVHHESIWIGPSPPHPEQARPLPSALREGTTRSRSFLFILAGIAVAATLGPAVPLFVPENGFIGINVPLTPSRIGSLSTRTTHPGFMEKLAAWLSDLGVTNPITNPFRLMTKGEVVASSSNESLLKELSQRSLSCAHPAAARYAKKKQGNCGYCFPCLIRRGAMFRVGADNERYAFDVLKNKVTLDPSSKRSADFRTLLFALSREPSPLAVLRNGPVPPNEVAEFDNVHRRGREELKSWLKSGASNAIRRGWPIVFK